MGKYGVFLPLVISALVCACDSGSRRRGSGNNPGGTPGMQNTDANAVCACDLDPICQPGCLCDPNCAPDASVEGVDTGEPPRNDAGRVSCEDNPRGCAQFELRSPVDCSCLGICENGYEWSSARMACVSTMGDQDAGNPPRPDVGRPPRRDAGQPFDSGPRFDSGPPRFDSGVPPRDSGPQGMDASRPFDGGVGMDARPPPNDAGVGFPDIGPLGDGGLPICLVDSMCNPPVTICEAPFCRRGCGQPLGIRCGAGETCNMATGRCDAMGGNGQLNSACTGDADCSSNFCFDFGGGDLRCTQACGASADCPTDYTCDERSGAKVCAHLNQFNTVTFANPTGASCIRGGVCKSNFCPSNTPRVCVETCSDSAACNGGQCNWYEVSTNDFIGACNGPLGATADRGACMNDTDCRSGICVNSACAPMCRSTLQCNNGEVCAPIDYTVCTLDLGGICLSDDPTMVSACIASTHGTTPIGGSCQGGGDCRGGLCFTNSNTCTDTCATNADCPATHRCKAATFGTTAANNTLLANVCAPLVP